MKIAYLILAHDQPLLLSKLVGALQCDQASVFIHIDKKFDLEQFSSCINKSSAHFISDRVKVNWGGYSQVQAMLNLLNHANTVECFDYFVFLSGRDYPLRSNSDFVDFLLRSNGRSYINFYRLQGDVHLIRNINEYCFYDAYAKLPGRFLQKLAKRVVRDVQRFFPVRQFLPNLTPYRGSTSWILSKFAVDEVCRFLANDAKTGNQFVNFFKSIGCCDEIFFQTIVLNSVAAPTCQNYAEDVLNLGSRVMVNENKVFQHYIDWNPKREDPAILDENDWQTMLESGKFFARKFDYLRSQKLIELIDSHRAVK